MLIVQPPGKRPMAAAAWIRGATASDPTESPLKVGIAPRLTAAGVVGRVVREGAWTQQALARGYRGSSARSTAGRPRPSPSAPSGDCNGSIGESAIAPHARISEIEPAVLDALRVATFELWFGRAPTAVAADTGVEVVRSISGRAAGFANALLRRLATGRARSRNRSRGPVLGTGTSRLARRGTG